MNKLDRILKDYRVVNNTILAREEAKKAIEAYIAERVLEELKQVPYSYVRLESGGEYLPTESTEYVQKRLEELASENT